MSYSEEGKGWPENRPVSASLPPDRSVHRRWLKRDLKALRQPYHPRADLIAPKVARKMGIEQPDSIPVKEPVKAGLVKVQIEFDGGTPCNDPKLGFGTGYGSYRILVEGCAHRIVRLDHARPMSNNAAEVTTLNKALVSIFRSFGPEKLSLLIIGDSQTALLWCNQSRSKKAKGTSEYSQAVTQLQELIGKVAHLSTRWVPRRHMVNLFGH